MLYVKFLLLNSMPLLGIVHSLFILLLVDIWVVNRFSLSRIEMRCTFLYGSLVDVCLQLSWKYTQK